MCCLPCSTQSTGIWGPQSHCGVAPALLPAIAHITVYTHTPNTPAPGPSSHGPGHTPDPQLFCLCPPCWASRSLGHQSPAMAPGWAAGEGVCPYSTPRPVLLSTRARISAAHTACSRPGSPTTTSESQHCPSLRPSGSFLQKET